MSQGVVFKQRYKSRNLSSTPALNRKHLAYIATRPGAVHNPGCGFGLWGRLPGISEPESINNLKEAKRVVTQASKAHTLYRAVISADGETAKRHDLYSRKTWESLINQKINVLANEMDIKRKDFCWAASMHYEKGHPHVHIMYWDNSDAVRQEHISKERFEIVAERVRSAFGRGLYREEIIELRREQREEISELRLKLNALMRETNLVEALALSHISKPVQDAFTRSLVELATTVPTKGSIKYAFLYDHPEYKKKLDTFIDNLLKVSDYHTVWKKYEQATIEISTMNGNGEEKKRFVLEEAKENFYRDIGNEVMDFIREYRKELTLEAPTERTELQTVIQSSAVAIAVANPAYQELRKQMPKERTPMWELLKDEDFRRLLGKLTGQVSDDIRINTRIRGYLDAAVKGLDEEAAKELRAKVYKDAKRDISQLIQDRLQADAGYPEQFRADLVTNLLIRLLGDASRSAGQQQAQRDLMRHRRELSKTAQKDREAQREQGGSWQGMEQ